MIQINDSEETSLKDFIEFHFLDSIRNDSEVDSLLYVYNILNIYKKLGGFEQFSDYEPDNK
jgi:hypothetical protein